MIKCIAVFWLAVRKQRVEQHCLRTQLKTNSTLSSLLSRLPSLSVKQELNFQDRDTQFYRFPEEEFGVELAANEKEREEELQEALLLLIQMGPDALLTMILRKPPNQRTAEELEVIFEELLHIKAVAHLSSSVRRELAAVLVFESHAKAGTDVEANTVRLEEHGKVVLVLEKSPRGGPANQGASGNSHKYTVMSGTPEKILEHLLESVRLDSGCSDLTVLQKFFRPDHTFVSLMLPVNVSVQEVMSSLVNHGGNQVLVKMNSSGDKLQLKLDATGVHTALGLNERLFICTADQVDKLTPLKEQLGPEEGTTDSLEQMSSKDLAGQLSDYDWELFSCVELVYYVFGQHKFRGSTTANLQRFMRRFNEVQYWVATEMCLCSELGRRAQLLRKFIKIASILKEQKNLNSFFAVMFGLGNSAVRRLALTWEDPSLNHRAYRLAFSKLSPPSIPFIPLLLKDMTFIHEGNETHLHSLVNFEKMRMVAKTVKIVENCRSQPYISTSPQKSRSDRLSAESAAVRISACSEQSLSLRSPLGIRLYVQNLRVIDNQRTLTQLSRTLEP
ncbi:UNVERIFIED_CONTAM: hypothetical protein FKN15_026925 [Acipenser sinensis]